MSDTKPDQASIDKARGNADKGDELLTARKAEVPTAKVSTPAHEMHELPVRHAAFKAAFAEWGQVFGDPVIATALLDRLLHHAVVVHIEGSSYRMRQHADLLPPASSPASHPGAQPKRRGRPPKVAGSTTAT